MKVTKDTKKWGSLTKEANNLSFIGEDLIDLEIQPSEMNPTDHYIVCINGNQIILGVGEKLKVPKSVYDAWMHSVVGTNKAKRSMKHMKEMKM